MLSLSVECFFRWLRFRCFRWCSILRERVTAQCRCKHGEGSNFAQSHTYLLKSPLSTQIWFRYGECQKGCLIFGVAGVLVRKLLRGWSHPPESNRRPSDYESDA